MTGVKQRKQGNRGHYSPRGQGHAWGGPRDAAGGGGGGRGGGGRMPRNPGMVSPWEGGMVPMGRGQPFMPGGSGRPDVFNSINTLTNMNNPESKLALNIINAVLSHDRGEEHQGGQRYYGHQGGAKRYMDWDDDRGRMGGYQPPHKMPRREYQQGRVWMTGAPHGPSGDFPAPKRSNTNKNRSKQQQQKTGAGGAAKEKEQTPKKSEAEKKTSQDPKKKESEEKESVEETEEGAKEEQTTASPKKEDTEDSKKEEGAATSKKEEDAASSKKEEDAASSKKEEGAASSKKEEGTVSIKKEEGAASSKKEEGTASSKKEEGTASSKKEEGTASSKKEEGTASSKKEEGAASAKKEKDDGVGDILKCHICKDKQLKHLNCFQTHLQSKNHKRLLQLYLVKCAASLELTKAESKLATQRNFVELSRSKGAKTVGKNMLCQMCDCVTKGPQHHANHLSSREHVMTKNFTKCMVCTRLRYDTREELEHHHLTIPHLKKLHQVEKMNKSRAARVEADELKEVKERDKVYNESPVPVAYVAERLLAYIKKVKDEDAFSQIVNHSQIQPYDSAQMTGINFIETVPQYLCPACPRKNLVSAKATLAHLRTLEHYNNFTEYLKRNKRRKEKGEKNEDEKKNVESDNDEDVDMMDLSSEEKPVEKGTEEEEEMRVEEEEKRAEEEEGRVEKEEEKTEEEEGKKAVEKRAEEEKETAEEEEPMTTEALLEGAGDILDDVMDSAEHFNIDTLIEPVQQGGGEAQQVKEKVEEASQASKEEEKQKTEEAKEKEEPGTERPGQASPKTQQVPAVQKTSPSNASESEGGGPSQAEKSAQEDQADETSEDKTPSTPSRPRRTTRDRGRGTKK